MNIQHSLQHIICMSETHLKNHSLWPLKSIATLNFYMEWNENSFCGWWYCYLHLKITRTNRKNWCSTGRTWTVTCQNTVYSSNTCYMHLQAPRQKCKWLHRTTLKTHTRDGHIYQATTNHGTLLDQIYTHNICVTICQVYDTYYSYHDLTAVHIRH